MSLWRACALSLVALAGSASAQTEMRRVGPVCQLPADPEAYGVPPAARLAPRPEARRAAPDCDPATEGARFQVTYTGFPPGAEASFQEAVDIWSCRIRSSQVIRVAASWAPLERSTLGSAGPVLYRNFPGAPLRDVWYASALADDLARRDLGDGAADIEAIFNSDFASWHIGSGPPPDGLYDLTTVVLHELGHGLGFIGALTVEGRVGRVGPDVSGFPFSYDLYTFDAGGTPLLDARAYPDGSTALANALTGDVTFQGPATQQAIGSPLPLHSPDPFVPGGSYSHLAETAYPANTPDGLMTPFIARNEFVTEPGTAVCAVLGDVGWTLAGDCAARVGEVAPPSSGELVVEQIGANPFSETTRLRLSSSQTATLSVTLVDVLGRVVQSLGSQRVTGGQPWTLTVDGRGLASGAYFVVVAGDASTVVPLTVAR